jgi:hypothetical protein
MHDYERLSGTRFQQPESQKVEIPCHSSSTVYNTGTGMGKTLSSALTLSSIGLGSKLVVKWLAKRFDVRGLPILLQALKEPDLELSWRKGKEREDGPPMKRRGIVTSESSNRRACEQGELRFSMQSQLCSGRSICTSSLSIELRIQMWTMLPNSHYLPMAGPSRVSRMNRWTLGGGHKFLGGASEQS